MYGYEILKALREQFGDVWEPKTGTIYPALRRLETRGFVQTELKEEKEFYSLTEKGKEILKDAGGLLEGDLEFAKFPMFPLSPRGGRMPHGRWPIFLFGFPPPFHRHKFEDKETRIRQLKRMREAAQKWLQAIDERIKELESEGGGGESKSEGT